MKQLVSKALAHANNPQVLSLAGNLTVSAMSIISVSLLFRALPVVEQGMWILFISTIGLADSFRAGFLTTALVRATSGATPARVAEVTGSAWFIAVALTAVMCLLNLGSWLWVHYMASGAGVSQEVVLLLRWFSIVLISTLPYFMATCLLQAELRFDRILYVRLLSQGSFVIGIIMLKLLGLASLANVVYCYVAASVMTSVLVLLFGWARLSSWGQRTRTCTNELTNFGKYSVGSYVGTYLLRSSDSFLINFMLGPAPLAVYNLAGRFLEIIDIPLRSFMATAIPALSAAFNQGRLPEVARLLRKNAGMLTWAFLPVIIGMILLADIPVYLIGGAKYQHTEAANLLRISLVIALIFPIDRFIGVTLDVVNQPRLNLVKVFLMLAVNVVGDVIALSVFHSIYAVAIASLPTAIAGFIFGYAQLRRFLPFSIRSILATGFNELKTYLLMAATKLNLWHPSHEAQ